VLEGSAVVIASGSDGAPPDMYPFGHNIFVAKPETCERRKSVCAKLGKAMVEAISTMLDRPNEALALLRKRFEAFDEKLIAAGFAEIRKGTPRPPAVTQADLENAELYNIGAGLLKPEEKLKSYDGVYTDEYVKKVGLARPRWCGSRNDLYSARNPTCRDADECWVTRGINVSAGIAGIWAALTQPTRSRRGCAACRCRRSRLRARRQASSTAADCGGGRRL